MRTVRDEYFLTLGEIADEYGRNGHEPGQIRQQLLNAFWRGLFESSVRDQSSRHPLISRSSALEALFRHDDHPGFYFYYGLVDKAAEEGEGIDFVDSRRSIALPAKPRDWTKHDRERAYLELSSIDILDVNASAYAALMIQFLGAYELLAVCHQLCVPAPPFWLDWDARAKSSQPKAARDFHRLAKAARYIALATETTTPTELRKDKVFDDARRLVGPIGEHTLAKVWKAVAPEGAKKGGRRPGASNRKNVR